MALSANRIARIMAGAPSEAAISRSIREGATTRVEAIERCYQRRIETAERHDRGEHWGSNLYSSAALRRDRHEQQALERAAMNLAAMQEMAA